MTRDPFKIRSFSSASNTEILFYTMSDRPQWSTVGRATVSHNWAPSSTSMRCTIAESAVAHKTYSPPKYLRRPFGTQQLSTSETDYVVATDHNSFLHRTTKLRNSMSASGLSFIRDIAESIPLPSSDQKNLITRPEKRPKAVDPLESYNRAKTMMITTTTTSPMRIASLDAASQQLEGGAVTLEGEGGGGGRDVRAETGGGSGYGSVGRPEHGRRKVFIDAAFNASNNMSTGLGMASGMGVLKAQSFYTDKNRPFGGGPTLFRGESHSVPKFTNYSTKQTMRRAFLVGKIGDGSF